MAPAIAAIPCRRSIGENASRQNSSFWRAALAAENGGANFGVAGEGASSNVKPTATGVTRLSASCGILQTYLHLA